MTDLSPDLRRLVDGARAADQPTAADRERVRAAIAAGLAAGAGRTAASTGKLGLLGRVGLVTLIGALLAGGTWWFASSTGAPGKLPVTISEPVADPEPAPDPEPVADPEPEPVADPDPDPDPDPGAKASITDVPRPARPKPRDPAQLAEEARLLREAETARRAGDIALATRRLDEHRRRFPRGALAIERDAARVLVLCDAGRTAEAARLAARFLRRHPRSPLADRVRSACERSIP